MSMRWATLYGEVLVSTKYPEHKKFFMSKPFNIKISLKRGTDQRTSTSDPCLLQISVLPQMRKCNSEYLGSQGIAISFSSSYVITMHWRTHFSFILTKKVPFKNRIKWKKLWNYAFWYFRYQKLRRSEMCRSIFTWTDFISQVIWSLLPCHMNVKFETIFG